MPGVRSKDFVARSRPRRASPMWATMLAVIAILALGLATTAIYLPSAMQSAVIDAAYRGSLEIADQIKITRGYYTQNVVAKALSTGALTPSFLHKDDPKAIPLPATFVKDISDLLKEKDTTLSQVSPYPWPHRRDRKMDDFEASAWEAFQADPTVVFSRQETKNGKRVLRVAVSDRMTSQTCVSCHNNHPQSAKRDWKIGDVRAVMQVTKVIEPYLVAAEEHGSTILWTLAAAALVVALALVAITCLVERRAQEKYAATSRIHYLAHHDALTELGNRVLFAERLQHALSTIRPGEQVAVLCLDLDRFKSINDTLGHSAGDAVLKAVAERIRSCVRETDIIARLGGDEFAIIQVAAQQPRDAAALAARLVAALGAPFRLDDHQLSIGASIGIALAPIHGSHPSQLMRRADLAVYRAKSEGRGGFLFFTPEMEAHVLARRQLEQDLGKALGNGELELAYQPFLNVAHNKVSGFEALLRWHHPERGIIPPEEFIPLAEETGLIVPIGEWVLRQACAEAATWPEHLRVSVNLSAVQFRSKRLAEGVFNALAASGLSANRLELEITESVLLDDTEAIFATLAQLRDIGTQIALDDFGIGYSSLSYLRTFPFGRIKIDRGFVADLAAANSASLVILRAVVSLASGLGMTTTAEGIETEAQLAQVRAEGCTEIQGYYFSPPRAPHELGQFLAAMKCSGLPAHSRPQHHEPQRSLLDRLQLASHRFRRHGSLQAALLAAVPSVRPEGTNGDVLVDTDQAAWIPLHLHICSAREGRSEDVYQRERLPARRL